MATILKWGFPLQQSDHLSSDTSFFPWSHLYEAVFSERLHVGGAAGGYRDHRHLSGVAVASNPTSS
jgi:hypothetical protein